MPRQTRRTRMQSSGGRRRTNQAVRDFVLESNGPGALEASALAPERASDAAIEELEASPDMATAPMLQRAPVAAPPSVTSRPMARVTTRESVRTATSGPARTALTDYGYVVGELKRIFITAAIVVAMLIAVALLHR